jgi:hypothetical protein
LPRFIPRVYSPRSWLFETAAKPTDSKSTAIVEAVLS